MSMEEPLLMEYDAAAVVIASRDPREFPVGYFVVSDAPPPFGGGFGGFSWFRSESERLRFLVDKELPGFWLRGLQNEEREDLMSKVNQLLNLGERADRQELEQVNQFLKGLLQIDWWGAFSELVDGDSTFAQSVRIWFRNHDESHESAPSRIDSEELAAFVEAIETYGT